MCYTRQRPSINFLGPEKRLFPGGSRDGYLARKVYVYVVFSPLTNGQEEPRLLYYFKELDRRVSKPGGFPLFFGKSPDCVAESPRRRC